MMHEFKLKEWEPVPPNHDAEVSVTCSKGGWGGGVEDLGGGVVGFNDLV